MEECRESRDSVVNTIKGEQVSASHTITPQALLSYGGQQCGHHYRKVFSFIQQAEKSLLAVISQENRKFFSRTRYHGVCVCVCACVCTIIS